jgi:hypothetical protein
MRRCNAASRKWVPTSVKRLDSSMHVLEDDWTYFETGRTLGRIYRYSYPPNAGRWAWFVLIALDGVAEIDCAGIVENASEARDACERLLPRSMVKGHSQQGQEGSYIQKLEFIARR